MFTFLVDIFNTVALAFLVFSVLLVFGFINSSIRAREKDIGILRSLGASHGDIAKIFIIEGVFVAALMALFGSVTCFMGYRVLDKYFISQIGYIAENYTIVAFTARQVALITIIAVATVGVALFYPIWRVSRKQPIDVIRRSE
ncbi:MAG: FtsX-like permease family protein [Christensenellaceae bacterium]|nr:FtsX-like permease family protein [Christensenellaceae bacterium]